MAGYDATKPAGTDTIAASDDLIRSNFVQIYANFGNQHTNSAATSTDCVHNRACGVITRDANAVGAAVDTAVANPEGTSFTPTLVEFHWVYQGTSTNKSPCVGNGYFDGTDNIGNFTFYQSSSGFSEIQPVAATYCIYIFDASAAKYARAACTFGANKFTLTWSSDQDPAGNILIMWTAFG